MLSAFKEQNLADAGFARKPSPAGFGSLWHSYRAQNERCWGWCHYLFPDDEPWGIIIHDLTVRDDFILN
jgi:AraC family transcriptional regulator